MRHLPRSTPALSAAAALLALLFGASAPARAAKADAAAAAASAASAPSAAAKVPAHVKVIEDDAVRIEEARGRAGAVSKVTVHTKAPGTKDYEVQVAPAGRDPSQDKGSAGRRTWSVLNF